MAIRNTSQKPKEKEGKEGKEKERKKRKQVLKRKGTNIWGSFRVSIGVVLHCQRAGTVGRIRGGKDHWEKYFR